MNIGGRILFFIFMHCIESSAAWCTGGLRDLIHHICGERSIRDGNKFFFVFFNSNNPEQLKAIWECRGQVGRLIAFHFSSPTFKQGNNIKVSSFYHESYFNLVFALFKLVLARLAWSFSSAIYYRNHCWVRMISRPLYLPALVTFCTQYLWLRLLFLINIIIFDQYHC